MSEYAKLNTDHQYVIVESGYTSRLSKHGGKYGKKLIKELKSRTKEVFEYQIDMEEEYTKVELLFVVDDEIKDEGLSIEISGKETDKVLKAVREAGLFKAGIACFRCDKEGYRGVLEPLLINERFYCAVHGITSTEYYVSSNPKNPVLFHVRLDCESG